MKGVTTEPLVDLFIWNRIRLAPVTWQKE